MVRPQSVPKARLLTGCSVALRLVSLLPTVIMNPWAPRTTSVVFMLWDLNSRVCISEMKPCLREHASYCGKLANFPGAAGIWQDQNYEQPRMGTHEENFSLLACCVSFNYLLLRTKSYLALL